jgi:hypothetical protein
VKTRKLTVGTKVRINSEMDLGCDGRIILRNALGTVVNVITWPFPYEVKYRFRGCMKSNMFCREELTRINKRKT